jgi:hypothetical protein
MAMAKCLFLYDESRKMSSVASTRQREAGTGDDWTRPVVHWEIGDGPVERFDSPSGAACGHH